MVDAVRQRIKDAGGSLTVWAVLHEDRCDSPAYADDDNDPDFGLSLQGIALNSLDAERLAALGPTHTFSKWIVIACMAGGGVVSDEPKARSQRAGITACTGLGQLSNRVDDVAPIPMRHGACGART